MKYKVGDKVRVKKDLVVNMDYQGWIFIKSMEPYKGQVVTISEVLHSHYRIEEYPCGWTGEMFEPVISISDEDISRLYELIDEM